MHRPKWLEGWGKGKNPFEASLIIDIPEIKVVEASFNQNPIFFAIGTSEQGETTVSAEKSTEGVDAKFKTELVWKIFYDSTALPELMPIEKSFDFMALTVAVSSGNPSVYRKGTRYIASGKKPSKGNAPVLLDYIMAKKIEEARKKTQAEIIDGPSS